MLFCSAALLLAGCGDDDDGFEGFDAGPAVDANGIDADGLDAGDMDAGDGTDAGEMMADAMAGDGALPDGAMGTEVPTAFFGAEQTRAEGANMGGTAFELNCEVGKVVVGFTGRADSTQMWGLAVRCSTLQVMEFEDGTMEVGTGWATATASVGSATLGDEVTSNCAEDEFGRGLYGKADDTKIYSLGFLCGTGDVATDGNIVVENGSNSDFFGGTAGSGFTIDCPENTLMTGVLGMASDTGGLLGLRAVCSQAQIVD